MKKIITAATAILLFGASAFASHTLMINGSPVDKVVSKITFDGDNIVLHYDDNTTDTHDMEAVEIHDIQLSSIEGIETGVFTGVVGNQMIVEGLANGAVAEVYNIQGVKCATAVAVETKAVIDLSGLNSGAYILRAGNQIVKFVK